MRITTTEILLSFAFFVWVYDTYRAKCTLKDTLLLVPISLFLGACLLSGLGAYNKLIAFREILQFSWLFGIYFLIYHFAKNRKDITTILFLSIVAGVIVSLVGLYQHYYVHEPFHFRINDNRLRAYATFGQPNAFGGYLTGLIPLSAGYYFYVNRPVWKIAALCSLLLISLALFATFSRGSWIGLAFGLMVMFILARNRSFRLHLIMTSVVLLLSGGIILGNIFIMQQGIKAEIKQEIIHRNSNSQRLLLAKSAFNMAKDHLILGVGYGNYPVLLDNYASQDLMDSIKVDYDMKERKWFVNPDKKPDKQIVHNMFIQIMAESGLVGLAMFLLILYAYYKSALSLVTNTVDAGESAIRVSLVGSFTGIMVSGIFGWPFSHGVQEILIMTMALSISPWRLET